MHKLVLEVRYQIGDIITTDTRTYRVVGYEYVPERAMRYILLHDKEGVASWEYMYPIEIDLLKIK